MLRLALLLVTSLATEATRPPPSLLSPDLTAARERSCEASDASFLPLDSASPQCVIARREAHLVAARSVGPAAMPEAVRHTLAVQLAARADLGLVTCEPPRHKQE